MKGASRQEVAEVLAVALLMSGGPASTHGPLALAAFDEFVPATEPGTNGVTS